MRLSRISIILLIMFFLLTSCKTKQKTPDEGDSESPNTSNKTNADFILADYVENGEIDFTKLKIQGLPRINDYFSEMKSYDLAALKNLNERKAFWINIYNIFVFKLLAQNYPDNNSIFKIEGFMNSKSLNIGGRDVTLFDISNEILRFGKEAKDPRINFALFNGTKSSAPLMKKMYTGENIENELNTRTEKFIKDPANVELDKKNKVLKLSQIFEYFKIDFKASGGSLEFVAKYMPEEESKFLKSNKKDIKIEFLNYDWDFAGFPPSEMGK